MRTNLTASQLRDQLKTLIDSNDELLVINVSGDPWASWGLQNRANTWLEDNM